MYCLLHDRTEMKVVVLTLSLFLPFCIAFAGAVFNRSLAYVQQGMYSFGDIFFQSLSQPCAIPL